MIAGERGTYVDVDGIRTFYVQAGSGHPVVLLHGGSPGACSLVNWGPTIEPLASAGFTVYAYDQPGFGRTESPHDYALEYRVTHAKAFLDAVGLNRFHLIGNSYGGYIAARIALEDDRTRQLVLVGAGIVAPPIMLSAEEEACSKQHSEDLATYRPSVENMRTLTMGTLWNEALVTDQLVQERYEMSAGTHYDAQLARR